MSSLYTAFQDLLAVKEGGVNAVWEIGILVPAKVLGI
jgi:hypothetical protein